MKNKFHIGLMIYTAIMVPAFGFMTGVLSAIVIYVLLFKFLDSNPMEESIVEASHVTQNGTVKETAGPELSVK